MSFFDEVFAMIILEVGGFGDVLSSIDVVIIHSIWRDKEGQLAMLLNLALEKLGAVDR